MPVSQLLQIYFPLCMITMPTLIMILTLSQRDNVHRPVNVLPSILLVVVGALSAAKHWSILLNPTVWAMAFVSCGIAVSSVVVNDYFDFRLGVDSMNAPEKPLPRCACAPCSKLHYSARTPCMGAPTG